MRPLVAREFAMAKVFLEVVKEIEGLDMPLFNIGVIIMVDEVASIAAFLF